LRVEFFDQAEIDDLDDIRLSAPFGENDVGRLEGDRRPALVTLISHEVP
jgi:hypothetical protein